MNGRDDIRTLLAEISERVDLLAGAGHEEELRHYLMSAVLRVWAGNRMYAQAYAHALSLFDGREYSAAQIITALDCAGEQERTLAIPAFFQRIAEEDARSGERGSRELIELIGRLLAAFALVNGDFTIEEASALRAITNQLSDYCDSLDVRRGKPLGYHPDMITELNRAGYHQPPQQAQAGASSNGASPAPAENEGGGTGLHTDPGLDTPPAGRPEDTGKGAAQEKEIGITIKRHDEGGDSGETLESVLAELHSLVGLEQVKYDVQSLLDFIRVCKLRSERGMKVPSISYHLVFTGNPGTGKTTVARLVAKLYYLMGILPSGQLVETDRSGLVAGYLGQTAIKTQKVIQEALGGVLFIDEAYSLANDREDSYGKEAIETILKAMEDHRDELVVIVAGYDGLMHRFIDSNPGLRSRFNKYFHFPDYDGGELLSILRRFCDTNGYMLAQDAVSFLQGKLDEIYAQREEHFGNARTIRNLFEHAINLQASRLVKNLDLTNEDLATLTLEDILPAMEVI